MTEGAAGRARPPRTRITRRLPWLEGAQAVFRFAANSASIRAMQLRSSASRASRASRHARHSSGVHFFPFITVLLVAENRENAALVDVDVGERPHHQTHLVAVDALLLVHAHHDA